MTEPVLLQLVAELAAGRIRVIDLTQTLSPDFPQIVLPPELGQAWPFRIEEASRYDARGPGWYWNNFSCSEHTGTHFDAPIHWISGRHLPDNSTDTIPATRFIAPACVLDCSREAAADADFLLTVDFLRKWERRHGRIRGRIVDSDADRLVEAYSIPSPIKISTRPASTPQGPTPTP